MRQDPHKDEGGIVERLQVADRILQYRFPPASGKHFGFNITALVDGSGGRAVLIDTAYEPQAAEVRADLAARGIRIEGVILSHLHPDHVSGLRSLPRTRVYASARFDETLCHYTEEEERRAYVPTDPLADGARLGFGGLELAFRLTPGHSPCSMCTVIADRFVHVADNIMTSNAGQDILPWAEYGQIEAHIESLETLRSFAGRSLLLSHGVVLDDARRIGEAIEDRLRYFRAVLAGRGRLSYEEAVAGCSCSFLHPEWLIRAD